MARERTIALNRTETTPIEVRRFSKDAREELKEKGYVIVELTGQSIASLREQGNIIEHFPGIEDLKSIYSEVAINPKRLFIPNSNNKTLEEQETLISSILQDLKIKDIDAIVGETPDYVDLAFTYLKATGVYLFGPNYHNYWTITKTQTNDPRVTIVGNFSAELGLHIRDWPRYQSHQYIFAAPLLVPSNAYLPRS